MLYVSEMDPRAGELARAHGLGLELIEFCDAERLADAERVARRREELRGLAAASLHAPYAELFPCAVDPEARALAKRRLLRAGEVCARLGVRRMIAHSGCAPRLYFPEWYVPRSVEFWRELLRALPEGVELLLENVLDPDPGELAAIVDGVGDPRLGVCLDVGHANAYSKVPVEDWVSALGGRIRHVHLHNNNGGRDEHAALDAGSLDMPGLLSALRILAPGADWCVESRDAAACLAYLEERGFAKPAGAEKSSSKAASGHIEVCRPGFDPARVAIPPLDAAAMEAARARQAQLAKPPGSLGQLEEIAIRFAGMTGRERNRAKRRRLLVFAADNGVVAEGVSSAPKRVTLAQTVNLARGLTGAATLARHFDAELRVYDVGVDAPGPLGGGVAHRRIANGTRNLAVEPAMTREEVLAALGAGYDAAGEAAESGIEVIGVGEMGIGNTTTSAAVLSALLKLPAAETVGRGGGVNDAGFARKREIVDSAVARLNGSRDVLEVLSEVGGLDIAAMCGAFIGAAARRLPAVIDGYISVVAALCAERLAPGCRDYMFASHASWERGYARAIEALGLKPMLSLEMRLGEGSGCPIAFAVIDAALAVHSEMATFDEARIDDGYLAEIRGDERLQR